MRVLVVGGAGYIGSHTVRALMRAGQEVVILDDLSTGHEETVPEGARLVRGDILKDESLSAAFAAGPFGCVMHFAAKALVAESVEDPLCYYRVNVQGSLALFGAAKDAGAGGVVFSSSAAVYGIPSEVPIREDAERRPINPYGRTKRMVEEMLTDFAAAYGTPSVSLRYFCAAGAEPDGTMGEDHDPETHLIPRVLAAARDGTSLPVYGTDYDTPDGTAVRDYVHVTDLAEAHVAAMRAFEKGRAKAYNLGTGAGFSVREVIETARKVTGREIKVEESPRRPGDPPRLVASSEKFRKELGWKPELAGLEKIIETAWRWHAERPTGYGG